MDKKSNSENSQKRISKFVSGATWLLMAALMSLILIPLFSVIWRDNTKKHTIEECRLIADAVLQKFVVDTQRNKKCDEFMKQFHYDMNAMSGWGYVYGEGSADEQELIYDWAEYNPTAVAVRTEDSYNILSGSFPKKEFDKALEKAEKERYATCYEVPIEEAEYLEFDGTMAFAGTSHMTEMDGHIYVLSELLSAKAIVISRFDYADVLASLAGFTSGSTLPTLEESYVSDQKVSLILVNNSDDSVIQTTEGIEVSAGEILKNESEENIRIKIGDDYYTGGMAGTDEYKVYAVVSEAYFSLRNVVSPIFLAFIYAIVFLLTGMYAFFYRDDIRRKRVQSDVLKKDSANMLGVLLLGRVRLMFFLTSVLASVLIILICLLCVVDSNRLWGDDILEDVEHYYELDSDNTEILSLFRDSYKLSTMSKLRYLIEASPERMTEEALSDLSLAVNRKIFLMNKKGAVIVSSEDEYDFTKIRDPDSPLYALGGLLEGKADTISVTIDGKNSSNLVWAVRLKNRDGILVIMDDESQTISYSDYYANYQAPEGMTLFAVDMDSGTILSSSNPKYSGKNILSIGVGDEQLKDGYAGNVRIEGRSTFIHTEVHNNRADVIASDMGQLFLEYMLLILATLTLGLLFTIVFLYAIYRIQKKEWDEPMAGYHQEKADKHRDNQTAVGRWLNPLVPFRDRTANSKIYSVLHILTAVILVVGYLLYQNSSTTQLLGETLPYLLQRNWQNGFNIYAIVYALLTDCTIIVIGLTLRMLVLYSGSRFGSRGETVARLFGSFIVYVLVAVAFGYGLVFIGVNTTAIFASAGIVGLAISIGAKDLIADVFAGIFIVFEGEFRTGDIVDINGYRGTVEEIGVRTTKVMSMENVKVFRNTQVSGAINMTQRYSIAEVRVDVSRGEPIEEVKKIFLDALPEIRKKISYDVSEITFAGIDQMTANGLVLLFQADCKEPDRVFIERELRWEFDLLMQKEQIASSGAIGSASVRK